jgi:sugar transferase EpsL
MTHSKNQTGDLLPDDMRMTRLGRFIRNASMDELPQLWNVVKDDMSLVGPRPLLKKYVPRYSESQLRRHAVNPGITGWAQIHGRNSLGWERRFEMDVWYVDHRSFWLDVKILAITLWKVLRREGITQEGHATMSEFLGTRTSASSGSSGK